MTRSLVPPASVLLALALTGFASAEPYQDALANITDYQRGVLSRDLSKTADTGLPGKTLTFALRFRSPASESTLALLRDSTTQPLFALAIKQMEGVLQLDFALRTDSSEVPLHVGVPVSLIGADRWHDVVARYSGPKLDLFVATLCFASSSRMLMEPLAQNFLRK